MTHSAQSMLYALTRQQLIARLSALNSANACDDGAPATELSPNADGTYDVERFELHMRHHRLARDLNNVTRALDGCVEMYDHMPVAHFVIDCKGAIRKCNAMAVRLLQQQDAGALIGRTLFDHLAVSSRQPFRFHLRHFHSDRPTEPLLVELRLGDDSRRFVEMVTAAVVRDGRKHFHLVAIDVSRIRALAQRERFLAEASERLFDVLDAHRVLDAAIAMSAPILADIAFGFAYGGDGALKHEAHQNEGARLNGSAQTLLREVSQILSSQWLHGSAENRKRAFLLQVDGNHDHAPWFSDSHLRLLMALRIACVAVVPLVARGHTLGTIVFFSLEGQTVGPDLSFVQLFCERVALAMDNADMMETLQNDVKLRDTVLATVSHDLKNPLSAILLKTERAMLWAERRDPQSSVVDVMKSIHLCGMRIQRLTQDLLDVSSVERNDLSIERLPVLLAELAEQALDAVKEKSAARNILISCALQVDPMQQVLCDPQRLLQVLGNLLDNAIKYSPTGGEVSLAISQRDHDTLAFEVVDTGRGFGTDELERMFEQFWRQPDTAHLGHGLGLYISRGIVQAHGGKIWAENIQPGGARVAFTIPLLEVAPPAA